MNGYYNEIDPYAAQWLRNLIGTGIIAPGDVDERSISDVSADDLRGYSQCHFFAGIGGWSLALRLAGWPDDRPVWTGSCPCQPFSAAGAGKAADDEHHLWPAWFSLIAECRPPTVFGEQVEAAIGWGWLDAVFVDMEDEGYACGSTVLPACGVGAPHIRQRLWFVANAAGGGLGKQRDAMEPRQGGHADGGIILDELGNTSGTRLQERERDGRIQRTEMEASTRQAVERGGDIGGLANTESRDRRLPVWEGQGEDSEFAGGGKTGFLVTSESEQVGIPGRSRIAGGPGFWSDLEWLPCTDGKARPVEPGTFPLAHGIQRRASKLRAYGNAIVPQVAAEFISAVMEARP